MQSRQPSNKFGPSGPETEHDMKKSRSKESRSAAKTSRSDFFRLRLYIAGQTPNSVAAIANLKKICEEKLQGQVPHRSRRLA